MNESISRFRKLEDGWVRDSLHRIEWGPSSRARMDYVNIDTYLNLMRGRLPNIIELFSLLDFSKQNPSVDEVFFPDTRPDGRYWTSTKAAWSPSAAWCVSFYIGELDCRFKFHQHFVRPVRNITESMGVDGREGSLEISRYIDRSEVAKTFSVPESTVEYWRKTRGLPFIRVGKHVRYIPQEVDEWVRKSNEAGSEKEANNG